MFKKITEALNDKDTRCYVLYCMDMDRNKTQSAYLFLKNYFSSRLKINFKYSGFYTEKYQDNYGKVEAIEHKLLAISPNQIVNFTLDDSDLRSCQRKLSIEFTVFKYFLTTVLVPLHFKFDFNDFAREYYLYFKTQYGFCYDAKIDKWPTAYAIGDWKHIGKSFPASRISQIDVECWVANCEQIKYGYIRDVFNENLLTNAHLTKKGNFGKPLVDEILDRKLGNIESVNSDIFNWQMNEVQLTLARDFIYQSDFII